MSFFLLSYRYPDGRFAGATVIEASAPIIARMLAAVFGLDDRLVFAGAHEIDAEKARQIPESMIERLLDHHDVRKLHGLLLTKKPTAPSVTVRPRRTRRRQSHSETPEPSAQHRPARRVGKR